MVGVASVCIRWCVSARYASEPSTWNIFSLCRYAFSIYFNIFNKQLLQIWMYPLTATCIQFALGGILGLGWFAASRRPIIIRPDILKAVLPLAMVHTLANSLTNVSLGLMAVSFAHTVKAMEPFFSVLLSMIFLRERPHPIVFLTLIPIVVGAPLVSAALLVLPLLLSSEVHQHTACINRMYSCTSLQRRTPSQFVEPLAIGWVLLLGIVLYLVPSCRVLNRRSKHRL